MKACRLCDGKIELAAPMAALPPVDSFTTNPQSYDLTPSDIYLCSDCGHVQLIDVIPPEKLFRKYLFSTGDNPALVEHYRGYFDDVTRRKLDASFVVEIGSNDGTLLKMFNGRTLGVDPSDVAKNSKVSTFNAFFTNDRAKMIEMEAGKATLILANHVFAHADDLSDMVKGVKTLLAPNGTFVFEAAYLHDMLDGCHYDMVYHEHLSYHSLEPLIPFFEKHGLELYSASHNDCKGGSMRGFVRHAEAVGQQKWYLMNFERTSIDQTRRKFKRFNENLSHLREKVSRLGGCIGYGASASSVAMMYHLGLEEKIFQFVDEETRRHGLCAPNGARVTNDRLLHEPIVILAKRYDKEIRARHPELAKRFVSLTETLHYEQDGACYAA